MEFKQIHEPLLNAVVLNRFDFVSRMLIRKTDPFKVNRGVCTNMNVVHFNDINTELLGIPDTDCDCGTTVQRICLDLAGIFNTVTISATKQGV